MSAETLLVRLERVHESGAGQWTARCPAHEDREPSLSVRETEEGRTLVHCHAGCTAEAVCAAAGVELRDLAPRDKGQVRTHAPRSDSDRHAEVARQASEIWRAGEPATDEHPYLRSHGVRAHGLRIYRGDLVLRDVRCDGALVIPLRDGSGELQSLQFVAADGDKRYLPGASTRGIYHALGAAGDTLVIVEGWATGAAVHEATGLPVRCAMSARNLPAVAKLLRARAPHACIIIAADNDESGTGQRAAEEAARAVGAAVAWPPSAGDWCDVRRSKGDAAVRAGIEAARAPAAASAFTPTGDAHVCRAVRY
jgi:putative DNA primase/helicase